MAAKSGHWARIESIIFLPGEELVYLNDRTYTVHNASDIERMIRERYGTLRAYAVASGQSERAAWNKVHGKSRFTVSDVFWLANALERSPAELWDAIKKLEATT